MSQPIHMNAGPLGRIDIVPTGGKLSVTPASALMVRAVGSSVAMLAGSGIDWGTGSGCIAIAAARIPAVESIVGIDVLPADVAAATANARRNRVSAVASFIQADVFAPGDESGAAVLEELKEATGFLTANPPASPDGDGLGWRRKVLAGARRFLVEGGPALVQISYQYGMARIEGLVDDVPGYRYCGIAATTGWVPFDLGRSDLARQLVQYAAEETRGGQPYVFRHPEQELEMTAAAALEHHRATGSSPLSKWQAHLYVYEPG